MQRTLYICHLVKVFNEVKYKYSRFKGKIEKFTLLESIQYISSQTSYETNSVLFVSEIAFYYFS